MQNILLKNVNIYNGKNDSDILGNYDILIEDGVIKKIAKDIQMQNVKTINLNGAYVIPGLINLHVHLPASGNISKSKVSNMKKLVSFISNNRIGRFIGIKICAKNAKTELLSGVTTIRTVGGISNFDSILKNKINKEKLVGPRILCANMAIGVKNGHMDGTVAKAALNSQDAIEMINKRKQEDVDLIKLMITGGILDTNEKGVIGLLKMPPEMVKACTKRAHELNLKVAAHVESKQGVEVAILNGVDTIEHGANVSDDILDLLKERNGAYVATFSPAIPLSYLNPKLLGYDEIAKYNSNALLSGMIDFTRKCLSKDILVGLGTDTGCPLVTHYNMWRELVFLTKCLQEIDNKKAINMATLENAKIAGIDNLTGSIEEGKSADLLILKENPILSLEALKNPLYVVAKGKIYKSKIKRLKKVEILLDEATKLLNK